jgi:hypothetical protein
MKCGIPLGIEHFGYIQVFDLLYFTARCANEVMMIAYTALNKFIGCGFIVKVVASHQPRIYQ